MGQLELGLLRVGHPDRLNHRAGDDPGHTDRPARSGRVRSPTGSMLHRVNAGIAIALVTVLACDKPTAPVPDKPPVPAPADATPVDATPVDAAVDAAAIERPTEAAAIEAVHTWVAAVGKPKPDALVRASGFPFRLGGGMLEGCPASVSDGKGLKAALKCAKHDPNAMALIRGEEIEIKASPAGPDTPRIMILGVDTPCPTLVPTGERATHILVRRITNMKRYPAEVLYGLYAVRIVDGTARVDGACLRHENEGE